MSNQANLTPEAPLPLAGMLTKHIMNFVIESIERGDFKLLLDSGLTEPQIQKISQLRSIELGYLASRKAHLFDLKVNSIALDLALNDVERERLAENCIQIGAPNEFLYQFFGISSRDASNKRTTLGINSMSERRVPSSDEEYQIIVKHYYEILNGRKDEELEALDYLNLHKKIALSYKEIPLKVIWFSINRFHKEGIDSKNISHDFPVHHNRNHGGCL
ncbi:MAG: DUF2857 family protein [Hydrogenovibrio crunogenus]|nr:DUF2857 family protein [Hydrogenovibrio crunogenus]